MAYPIKTKKALAVLTQLADHFGTEVPRIVWGTTRRGASGTYHKPEPERVFFTDLARTRTKVFPAHGPWIAIDPSSRNQLETLAHEYAHHLEHVRGLEHSEPPSTLPEVREALGCPKGHYLSGPI